MIEGVIVMKPVKTIKSLDRMMSILNVFIDNESLSLAEICEITNESKSTVHDILSTLKVHKLIQQDELTKHYSLGVLFLQFGGLYSARNPIKKIADEVCVSLSSKYKATVHLTTPENGFVRYIGKYEDIDTKVNASRIGTILPMSVTGVGKATLAFLGEDYLQDYVLSKPLPKYTVNSITDENTLRSELETIREKGYAVDNEEITLGIKCVAAPIFDVHNNVIASISLTKLTPHFNEESLEEMARDIIEAASLISGL